MTKSNRETKLYSFRPFPFVALIYALVIFLTGVAGSPQDTLPRSALWEVVHNVCVPGQSLQHNPNPCLRVELNRGIEKGFAILKDPRGAAQFLLIPTVRISGIESPAILEPNAMNYFADAWEARTFINAALERILPRDGVGLAINSVLSRSQDQLHIHIACVHPNVLEALQKNQGRIGNRWARFNVSLVGRYYAAIWVSGEDLGPNNPFRLLAESLPDAPRNIGDRTLVVIGLTRTDGSKGFVILTDHVKKASGDLANGEELLDHTCRIAADKK
jgi:CDP-diacylglycerol pyrophosphatase